CHNPAFLNTYDMLANLDTGGTFLLTTTFTKDEIWDHLPALVQKQMIDKKIKFYIIDAVKLGLALGLGARINMIMQTAFFAISGIISKDEAIKSIKNAIKKTYGIKGDKVVQMNYGAVDGAIENIVEVKVPKKVTGHEMPPTVPADAPDFVKTVTAKMMEGHGEDIPVSQFPNDGRWPTATTQWEKRNIAVQVSQWDPEACIQCGRCSLVCPHGCIRMKVATPEALKAAGADASFKTADAVGKEFKDMQFTIQVSTSDCCGCTLCVTVCPGRKKGADGKKTEVRALSMAMNSDELKAETSKNWKTFLALPEVDEKLINIGTIKGSQFKRPLFEFSGACAGCGETPYIKLVTQMIGDRMLASNATGCSSIYSGNLPTTPYAKRADGRGPAWSNSLFEDNAEHGLGMRQAVDKLASQALELLAEAVKDGLVKKELADALVSAPQKEQGEIEAQRARVAELKAALEGKSDKVAKRLYHVADYLVKKSVWIIGGDGWAYDIGYGGVDHVLASGKNVNILVLDTEVYSNTGGQMSKSTPRAAVAQFAAGGKNAPKKNMGLIFSTFGTVYVARISIGANPQQAIKAIQEAEAYDGPSLIIAYAHCINHGINMAMGLEQQKKAVECGHWSLFRYNPALEAEGKNPMIIDSKEPTIPFAEYALNENRYRMLKLANPTMADELMALSQKDVDKAWKLLKGWAKALDVE
ncbi:MAG: pyruvate:ferredoxin (flavodoxin) oxidoreductase, partial [Desulfobulbaceae bacterium]|nr:pyruvate:ferredoxin (flavodoxin) oxidoreductase [Desulfobulbaceae bacterium]